jgi:glycosyltransferase involved in cell wall biosynthesis/O-antigen/teichoic acid export membrane protein
VSDVTAGRSDAEVAVRRSAGWLTLSAIGVGALNFLYSIALAWLLPVHEYPAFAGSQALLVVCGTAASASVPWMLSQTLAEGSSASRRGDAVSFALSFTVVVGLVAAGVVALLTVGMSQGLSSLPMTAGLAAFAIFAAATSTGYFQGRQQFGRLAGLQTVEVALKVATGFALAWAGAGVAGVIAGIGIGALVMIAAGAPPLLREMRLGLRWIRDRRLWRLLLGLTGIQVGVVVLTNMDLILGSLLSHDSATLAGYQVSAVLSRVPFFLASSLSIAVFTKLVSGAAGMGGVSGASIGIFLSSVIPVAMSVLTLPLPVAELFLPHAYPALVLSFLPFTVPAGVLAGLANLLTTFFQASGRFRLCCLLLAVGLVVDGAGVVVGLATLGVRGLAYGSLAGQLVTALLLLGASLKLWGRSLAPSPWAFLPMAASLPLLLLPVFPALWLVYAVCLCATVGWFALFRSAGQAARARPNGSSPRVYLVTSHPVGPPWDGADTNLARILLTAPIGVDFTYIGSRADTTPWLDAHVRRAIPFARPDPTAREQLRLLSWLSRERPDVDLVHLIVTFRRSVVKEHALRALPLVRGGRLVVTCPSGHYLPLPLLRTARAVVAVSRGTEERLRRAGLDQVHRIPPAIDVDRFTPAASWTGQEILGLSARPTILFAGHYDPGGGLDAALDVLERLRPRVPSIRLLTAMRVRPDRSEARRRADVEARVRARGLADAIVELGPAADIRAALHASVAAIFQPATVGIKMDLPMVLLEALACGRAVVVSPVDSLGELADGTRAVVVEEAASDGTVDHLERLATDPAYALACGTAARELALRRYAGADMAAAYAELYRSLLAGLDGGAERRPVVGTAGLTPADAGRESP